MNSWKAGFVLIIAGFFQGVVCAASSESSCQELKAIINKGDGAEVLKRRLIETLDENQTTTYSNLDIDGDDISDELTGGCSASQSSPDSCTLSLHLSTGKKFFFVFDDGERFVLMRFHSRVYAITNYNSPGKASVVALSATGVARVCKQL